MTSLRIVLHGNGHDNVNVFGLGGIDLLHFCCCLLLRPLLQSKFKDLLLFCQYFHSQAAVSM